VDKREKENSLLTLLGIKVDNDHISIDFEEAKSTLRTIGEKLDSTASKIKENLNQGKIQVPSMGIEITPQKVDIDLKEAKREFNEVMEKLSKLATAGVEDLDLGKYGNKNEEKKRVNPLEGFFSFEILSDCSKDEVSQKIGLESQSGELDNLWSISSPKVVGSKFDSSILSQNLVKLLSAVKRELKELKSECNSSIKLVANIKISGQEKYSLKLPDSVIDFLSEIGGEFVINIEFSNSN